MRYDTPAAPNFFGLTISDTSTGTFVTISCLRRPLAPLRFLAVLTRIPVRLARLVLVCFSLTLSVTWIPSAGSAQVPASNIGLQAVGAVGLYAGPVRLERSSRGQEGGLLLDLGWLRGQSLRLQGEISILRASLTEYVEIEDSTFRGNFYDLSSSVTAVWLTSHTAKVSPYVLAGLSVHALSSAFNTVVLDRRYNANRFGSQIGAGLRLRFGSSRQALFVEGRRVIADEVDRNVLRFGGVVLMGDLYR